ncbi:MULTISPECIES: hypothetical protein [unclassified Corallococcus]|uniref:hypothetical protein n=1 Tax=unclassified Corallococcus TaxID=2685029 RepID=UPI001A90A000|nr:MULTISPECIES: hypothetical protein [unclassified Corallococcus]MBN9682035.1 hypothetical protein [Corallococcus sp. NCSPR001]WAS86402.1 hypothetical protein O0N60_05365 [Corallococcus sp. NCRR]
MTGPGPEAGSPLILSFRHLLTESVSAFLDEADMTCPQTADALSELLVTLSRYREEGALLFPTAFLGDDLGTMMEMLGGHDPIPLGSGPRNRATIQRALKQCAPLGQGRWWALYLVRDSAGLTYGIFRTDPFPLAETPLERLRHAPDRGARVVGVLQLADNIIELRGGGGLCRHVYLSGARVDLEPPSVVLDALASAVTEQVLPSSREYARGFFQRVLFEVMQSSHGTLVAVLPRERAGSALFVDGILLPRPMDVVALLDRHHATQDGSAASAVRAASQLLRGMMATDGITVLRADGCILGYNVFVRHPETLARQPGFFGGARRRTFEVLCAALGNELAAAFIRSQDGDVACRRA